MLPLSSLELAVLLYTIPVLFDRGLRCRVRSLTSTSNGYVVRYLAVVINRVVLVLAFIVRIIAMN